MTYTADIKCPAIKLYRVIEINKKHKYHVACRVNIACCVDEETFMKHCFTKIYRLGGSVYFAPDSVTMAIAVIF